MQNIVLGVDGSSASSAATRWCAHVALATGSRVHVVHGLRPEPELGVEQVTVEAAIVDQLEGPWIAPLVSAGVDVEPRLVPQHPVDAVLSVAEEVDTDLVIVGRTGHIRTPGQGLGSVAHKILNTSARPVGVVPAVESAGTGEGTIVLGLDDSPDAAAALDFAVAFGEAMSAPIDAIRVVDPGTDSPVDEVLHIDIEALQARADDTLGVVVSGTVGRVSITAGSVVGNPADELVSRSNNASVLVLGHGQQHAFGGHLLGSTAHHCIEQATCPVIVVSSPA